MKKKLLKFLIIFVCLLNLTSCGLIEFIDAYNSFIHQESLSGYENYPTDSEFIRGDTGNSLEILNEAFNGTINIQDQPLRKDFSNISKQSSYINASRLNIDENVQSLDYLNGAMPSSGKINSLVIPVDFSDYPAPTYINLNSLKVNYQSVSSFYYNYSYGQLDISFDIVDWVRASNNARYYQRYTSSSHIGEVPGVSALIKEVLTKLDSTIDFSKYDNDKDGYIDSIYIIYSHPIDSITADFWWAYQYCYFENDRFDGVNPNYYIFASYDFMFHYDKKIISADTYIHETGHILGLTDYYDYDLQYGYNKGGLGGADVMDCNKGDHNPFSKMSLGWIKDPILVTGDATISISPFDNNGDVIMICDNYDSNKGLFQDYFLITYFKYESKLNRNSTIYSSDGIRLYRVHAELSVFVDGNNEYEYFNYRWTGRAAWCSARERSYCKI